MSEDRAPKYSQLQMDEIADALTEMPLAVLSKRVLPDDPTFQHILDYIGYLSEGQLQLLAQLREHDDFASLLTGPITDENEI